MSVTPLLVIRHAETTWNADRRIQGSTDIDLSERGRDTAAACTVPVEFDGYRWVSSPLVRAQHTARLLGAKDIGLEPRISEMSWGEWEGLSLSELRQTLGDRMRENEARGVDFRPTGGESPRDVMQRLQPWLAEVAEQRVPTIAVTHKGVIRALLALATGWDMLAKPPCKLNWACAHLFCVSADGVRVSRTNVELRSR